MKGSRLKTSTVGNTSKNFAAQGSVNVQRRDSLQNQQNQNASKIEDEYISNLQKQIYYLELEMKLMKDKEIDTKNKVGGYEILFRDGVPLNEHFLALKTKYTNERDHFEKYINDLSLEIINIENENKYLQNMIEQSNSNYFEILEKTSQNSDFYNKKIFEFNSKLINEQNTKESLLKDKEIIGKSLYKFNSENVHHLRTMEKDKLFKENNDEKNKLTSIKAQDKFQEVDKLVVKSLLEQEQITRKFEHQRGKWLENENQMLIVTINKLERDIHMAKAKITELENTQTMNRKYLLEEELNKQVHEKENRKLNDELDGLVKLNEETLKEKVKENVRNQSIIIKNSISNNELKMNQLLNKFKDEEAKAKDLLEEKNAVAIRINALAEVIQSQMEKEQESKREIIDVKNEINELQIIIEDNKNTLTALISENELIKQNSDKNEIEIKATKKKIEELQQKIELNTILKDIDINELKTLSQNNAMVNNSINSLISKWDKVQTKLQEIEDQEKK
jgi:hypothetical protein